MMKINDDANLHSIGGDESSDKNIISNSAQINSTSNLNNDDSNSSSSSGAGLDGSSGLGAGAPGLVNSLPRQQQ